MIDEYSGLAQEKEILFTMRTVFRIVEIKQTTKNNCNWEAQLTITDESDPQLTGLTDCIKEEINDEGWYRMAEELYNELLANTSNDSDRTHIYHMLGYLKHDQGEYEETVTFYEKSLETKRKTVPEDDASSASTYGNIGTTYRRMGDYSKALEFYEKI
ncbi:unnamed protein product [Rotaria socialis]|uniref:Tetratricopeptide repeat protein n=1 Tax=Rotaria socialis TaxID=392032 RepID=A0A818Q2M0_9BILA|nr:unnamed protein product [Rotaria socialis]